MECKCKQDHLNFSGTNVSDVKNADNDFDGAWFIKCNQCRSVWIRILFEAPQYSDSTHWYAALLPDQFDFENFRGSRENVNSVFEKSQISFRKGIVRGNLPERFIGVPKRLV